MADLMTHRVKAGDTLSSIAKQYGTTVDALVQANKIRDRSRIYVGRTLIIPVGVAVPPPETPAPTAPVPTPEPPAPDQLGALSRRFEARNPGDIAHNPGDPGGASYGSYQFESKRGSVQRFVSDLKDTYPDFYAELAGKEPGTNAFDAAWKALYAREPERFFRAQHEAIERTHYRAALREIGAAVPALDLRRCSRALLDVVWSTAVQHGPKGAGKVFAKALEGKNAASLSQEAILSAVYAERGRTDAAGTLVHFSDSSKDVQRGVAKRYGQEVKEALAMLKREQASAVKPPPSAPTVDPDLPAPQATPAPAPSSPPPAPSTGRVDPRRDPANATSFTPADPDDTAVVPPAPPAELHVKVPFVSQFTPNEGFPPGGTACFLAAKEMARRAGARVGDPRIRFQLATAEDENGRLTLDTREAAAGRAYLDQQLAARRPVVVGVSHQSVKKYNSDGITDHFVVVTGRGVDDKGRTFYSFNDPATSNPSRGGDTNLNNRFLIDGRTGGLFRDGQRTARWVVDRRYDVSLIRRNE